MESTVSALTRKSSIGVERGGTNTKSDIQALCMEMYLDLRRNGKMKDRRWGTKFYPQCVKHSDVIRWLRLQQEMDNGGFDNATTADGPGPTKKHNRLRRIVSMISNSSRRSSIDMARDTEMSDTSSISSFSRIFRKRRSINENMEDVSMLSSSAASWSSRRYRRSSSLPGGKEDEDEVTAVHRANKMMDAGFIDHVQKEHCFRTGEGRRLFFQFNEEALHNTGKINEEGISKKETAMSMDTIPSSREITNGEPAKIATEMDTSESFPKQDEEKHDEGGKSENLRVSKESEECQNSDAKMEESQDDIVSLLNGSIASGSMNSKFYPRSSGTLNTQSTAQLVNITSKFGRVLSLAEEMKADLQRRGKIRDRRWHGKLYSKCTTHGDIIQWLKEWNSIHSSSKSRQILMEDESGASGLDLNRSESTGKTFYSAEQQAVWQANEMLDAGYLDHVVKQHCFRVGERRSLFFHFHDHLINAYMKARVLYLHATDEEVDESGSTSASRQRASTLLAHMARAEEMRSDFTEKQIVRDRRWKTRVFKNCFLHSDVIDWIRQTDVVGENGSATDESMVVWKANELIDAGYLRHVCGEHRFRVGETRTLFFCMDDLQLDADLNVRSICMPTNNKQKEEQSVREMPPTLVLAAAMKKCFAQNGVIKDRKWRVSTFRDCFLAADVIQWVQNHLDDKQDKSSQVLDESMSSSSKSPSNAASGSKSSSKSPSQSGSKTASPLEKEAVIKANELVDAGYIGHVCKEHRFRVGDQRTLFFRFYDIRIEADEAVWNSIAPPKQGSISEECS